MHSSVEKREIHCYADFFSSNQFRVKFFSYKVNLTEFFRQNSVAAKFCKIHRKNEKFTLSPKRQINDLVILLVKPLLSRNFCQKKCESKFP